MSDSERPVVDVYLQETAHRQQIAVTNEGRTTQVRLRGPRPIQVFELEAGRGFLRGGALLLPEVAGRASLGPLAAALDHLARRPDALLLVAGHAAGAPAAAVAGAAGRSERAGLSERRARVTRAVLCGDAAAYAGLAGEAASVAEWQALLGWCARRRGLPCDPGAADGKVGPKSRAALAAFREAARLGAGPSDAPAEPDWRALFSWIQEELARLIELDAAGLAARQEALRFVPASP